MNRIRTLGIIAFILLGVAVWVQQKRIAAIKKERDRYQMNSDAMLWQMRRWQIDSTTMAADVGALRLTAGEFQRYRAEDADKIRQMGIKIKRLKAVARHRLEVEVPVSAPLRDSVVIRDTVPVYVKSVEMVTPHISLKGIIENNTLVGAVSLPVTLRQAVWIEYKRRWLFWKKPKAIHQTITSDNPYVKISYSEYIIIQK